MTADMRCRVTAQQHFGAGRRQIEHSSGSLDSGLRVKKAIAPD